MDAWIWWLIAAGVLLIVEVFSLQLWTLCLAVGCLCAAVADLLGYTTAFQLGVIAGGAMVAFVCLLPVAKKWHERRAAQRDDSDASNADAMVGRRATVIVPIAPGAVGRVKLDGDNWQARAADPAESFAVGQQVTVHALDSIILIVK